MYQLPNNPAGYDIIGDVHGCLPALESLLELMDYRKCNGTYQHPKGRKLIFLGDLIDRGPYIRETVLLVRSLVDAGTALLVLGNHEFNALTYTTLAPIGFYKDKSYFSHYLRPRTARNESQIEQTLEQFSNHPQDLADSLAWFRSLPLVLENDDMRVIHACWDQKQIDVLAEACPNNHLQEDDMLHLAADESGPLGRAVSRILTGTSMALPDDCTILGRDGVKRRYFRTMFWSQDPKTLGDVVFQPDSLPEAVASLSLTAEQRQKLLTYPSHEKPVFIGHYWCHGKPKLLRPNVACLDFSAVNSGLLVAYRAQPGQKLSSSNFVWVESAA